MGAAILTQALLSDPRRSMMGSTQGIFLSILLLQFRETMLELFAYQFHFTCCQIVMKR
jgi:hypothetical protein